MLVNAHTLSAGEMVLRSALDSMQSRHSQRASRSYRDRLDNGSQPDQIVDVLSLALIRTV